MPDRSPRISPAPRSARTISPSARRAADAHAARAHEQHAVRGAALLEDRGAGRERGGLAHVLERVALGGRQRVEELRVAHLPAKASLPGGAPHRPPSPAARGRPRARRRPRRRRRRTGTRTSPPPRAYAAARAGDVSFAVRTARRAWSWRGTTTYRSASVVKAMLLVAYLRRADVRGRRAARGRARAAGPDGPPLRQPRRGRDPRPRRRGRAVGRGAARGHDAGSSRTPSGAAPRSPPTTRRASSSASTGSSRAATAPTRCACCAA